jgi:hypothetical protein
MMIMLMISTKVIEKIHFSKNKGQEVTITGASIKKLKMAKKNILKTIELK